MPQLAQNFHEIFNFQFEFFCLKYALQSCKLSAFNVSYSAMKYTVALIHHYHMWT